jgi:thiol-disulfide isomerase/thioredoxin
MKARLVILSFLFALTAYAQTTTYSKKEEAMVHYANNGLFYAMKYDSLQNVKPVIDSCWKFIKEYPNSFAKPNVLSYMLEMTVVITRDLAKINPLIDSVLSYDKLPVTKQRIGTILIERNLDLRRGREFVADALPELTVPNHIYNSYLTLAKSDIASGNFASARMNFEAALKVDSTRSEAWYEYLSFLKMRELSSDANIVLAKINELEEKDKLSYANQNKGSSNINRNLHGLTLVDLDSSNVKFDSFEGKVVVINQFNFWCRNCAKEFPTLKKIIKEFPQVKFIFVNAGETVKELRDRYFRMKEFSFLKNQMVLFVSKDYFDKIDSDGVPHTLVVDKAGNIRFDYLGYKKELETMIRDNLNSLTKEQIMLFK